MSTPYPISLPDLSNMYTVYTLIQAASTSWISYAGELDTVYKLDELGLYPVYSWKLRAGKLR